MQILRHRFRILNQQLASSCDSESREPNSGLIKHQSVTNRANNRTIQTGNSANNLTETPISQNFYLSEFSMSTNNQLPEEVLGIHTLRQAYSDLYDVTELINKIYGYQILLEVAYNFVSLVSHLYYALETLNANKTVDHNQRGEESIILEVVSSLCWVIQNLVRVLSITASCFAASEEARRTGTVVQKLLLRQTLKGDTSAELQLFSMQLLSNKVEFTAGGFFSVNLSLVYSMVGVATTYIIILLQFK
jgi:gustatory receptor